jgi:hypothetical protein
MATTSKQKEEQIYVQIGEERIELTGADKEAFELDRKQMRDDLAKIQKEIDAQKQVKVSAYTKLGLTKEEINSIL